MNLSTWLLIGGAAAALIWSFVRDRQKTKKSIGTARGMFFNIAGEITGILALIGLFLALVPEEVIRNLLGGSSLFLSTVYGAAVGTVTILPAFVAFPLAGSLVERGAHLTAVAAFITTLTMVGFATLPIEIEHFGAKFAAVRNLLSFAAALLVALGLGVFL